LPHQGHENGERKKKMKSKEKDEKRKNIGNASVEELLTTQKLRE
jgi:hypothetical protein